MNRDDELEMMAAFDRVKHCPPAYVAPTKQGVLDPAELERRTGIFYKPEKPKWRWNRAPWRQ